MKKKKIAMFATGWAAENLYHYFSGVCEGFAKDAVDLYLFLCYPTFSDRDAHLQGEVNIFQLPDIHQFDGVIVFANGIDFPQIIGDINERCQKAGVPVVYTGNDQQDGFFVGSDNYPGARILCDHLIEEHGAKKFIYIAGSRENMDSNTRLKALQDSLQAHGYTLDPDNLFYSNWGPTDAARFVKRRIKEAGLPDAIVCANDTIAMITCSELRESGYNVPEDVKVTGFDDEFYAQIFDPAISSVDQRFDLIGKHCAEALIAIFAGRDPERKQKIPCEFVPSESCGCMSCKDFASIRKALGRDKFMDNTRRSLFDQNLSMMERVIMHGKSYNDLRMNFAQIHETFQDYQGKSFQIVLDPCFEQSIRNQDRELRKNGYSQKMDVIFSVCDGKVMYEPEFDTSGLVLQTGDETVNHQYIFLPLHEDDSNMGYIVFGDDIEKVKQDQYIRKYVERINMSLGKYLRDLRVSALHARLLELTETDALTHVKNRTAYESRVERMQIRMHSEENLHFAVGVFDVNNLKRINDKLGHEAGDEYLINACRLICVAFKKSAVYRIGGDEFAVIMENDDFDNREEHLKEMYQQMVTLHMQDLPEPQQVSVAYGIAVYDSSTDHDFADIFQRADTVMYENKAIMKENLNHLSLRK